MLAVELNDPLGNVTFCTTQNGDTKELEIGDEIILNAGDELMAFTV